MVKYDFIIVGSSPLNLIYAMDQKRQNKSVLVIDDKEVLGGAWYTKDLWGYSNLEVGCHTLKNKSKGYRVLKEQGVPMEVMQIQPAVTVARPSGLSLLNSLRNSLFYFAHRLSGRATVFRKLYDFYGLITKKRLDTTPFEYCPLGCGDMISGLKNSLQEMDIEVRLNTKIESLKFSGESVKLLLESQGELEANQLVLTKNFNIPNFEFEEKTIQPSVKSHIGEHYVLRIAGEMKTKFSFIHVHEDELINLISDTSRYTREHKDGEIVLCVSTKTSSGTAENNLVINDSSNSASAELQAQTADSIMKKLKGFGLIDQKSTLKDALYETYPVNVKAAEDVKNIVSLGGSRIQFLDSTDLIDSLVQYC